MKHLNWFRVDYNYDSKLSSFILTRALNIEQARNKAQTHLAKCYGRGSLSIISVEKCV